LKGRSKPPLTDEHIKKLRFAKLGKPLSEEHRKKLLGRPSPMKGRSQSEESKKE